MKLLAKHYNLVMECSIDLKFVVCFFDTILLEWFEVTEHKIMAGS
jgi:hypothetical protein